MKKLLLASAFALVPIIAFAGGGGAISGNLSGAASMSASGIAANQGTAASVNTKGNGLAVEGAVAGNYATITSTGAAKAGKAGVTQVFIGLGLLYRPTVKLVLAGSFVWALIVWWFGEAFGILFMNMAQPLTETRRPALTQTLASACPAECIATTIPGIGVTANKASSAVIQRR